MSARAEYRVFILEIRNTQNQNVRQVHSTLDPTQYASVYPLNKDEIILYQDSWLCPGNTSHLKSFCPRPNRLPTNNSN